MIDPSAYRDLFASEAQERLEVLNHGLLALERNPRDKEALDEIFRSAHTLKGMSATMGYEQLASLAHALEDLLDRIRREEVSVVPAIMNLLFEGVDGLANLLADVLADRPSKVDFDTLLRKMIVAESGALAPMPESLPQALPRSGRTTPTPVPLPGTIRVGTQRLDALLNLVGEMVINRSRLARIQQRYDIPELKEALEEHNRLLAEMRDAVLQTRMVPISQVFSRFPRMVRDLLHDEGKEADFLVQGGEIELDRTILQEITDPLMHLLRNAVAHGIETPPERERQGKPRQGTIRVTALRERDEVIIEISDDGQGMSAKDVRETAIARRIVTAEEAEALAPSDVLTLICDPRFSTARQVTEVSGRGVGMNVVKCQVEALRGSLEISSEKGVGTTFRLKLPLTLAIIEALLVEVGGEVYALPLSQIDRTLEVNTQQVKRVQRHEVLLQGDDVLPLVYLADLLEVPAKADPDAARYAVIVEQGRQRVGLVVDRLLDKEEIVIKSLEGFLGTVEGLAGATILGEGQVVLILDVGSLIS